MGIMSRYDTESRYYVPTRPYTPIDALNQRAAAVGSPRYAQLASHADYNGHRVTVAFNDHRGYYTAEYVWAGRVVLARGSFAQCLAAALAEQARGALGGTVRVYLPSSDADAIALCEATPALLAGDEPDPLPWYTWQHSCAAQSARDYAHPRASYLIFDWELMQAAANEQAYLDAVRAKYGQVYQ